MKQLVLVNKAINLSPEKTLEYIYQITNYFINRQLSKEDVLTIKTNDCNHYVYNVVLDDNQKQWIKEKHVEIMHVTNETVLLNYMDLASNFGLKVEYGLHENKENEKYMAVCTIGPCKEESIDYLKKEFQKYL